MVTFKDIFKSDFLNSDALSSVSLTDGLIVLAIAFVLGLFICLVYKKTYRGVMQSFSFGVSLVAMPMIAAFLLLAVTSNIVLSLGMVGALSIVRFRTAVKDPLDVVYVFWAIAAGIVLGAGLIPFAIIGTVIIGVVMLVVANIKTIKSTPYILIVKCHPAAEPYVSEAMKSEVKKFLLKSKTFSQYGVELTYEVALADREGRVVNKILGTSGVESAVLVSYNGEYMS